MEVLEMVQEDTLTGDPALDAALAVETDKFNEILEQTEEDFGAEGLIEEPVTVH